MSTNDLNLSMYCNLMDEVKRRTEVIKFFLAGSGHALFSATTIESTCLQLRKILEIIALGSLVANKDIYTQHYANLTKAWNARIILRDIERVNPDFYPKPIVEIPTTGPAVSKIEDRVDGFLTRDDFEVVYEKCGALMHADNPFGSHVDYQYYEQNIPIWMNRIITLLNSHTIRLVDNPNLYIIHMKEDRDDKAHGYVFSPVADSSNQ